MRAGARAAKLRGVSEPIAVMVVDDQSDMRFLYQVILGDHDDMEIVAEADGALSALEALADADPDVLILDAIMPAIDGYEAAPRIRELRPQLPIVLCSAHVDEVVRQRASGVGITHVIGKQDIERVPEILRTLLGRPA